MLPSPTTLHHFLPLTSTFYHKCHPTSEDKWTQSRAILVTQEGSYSANVPWRVRDVQEWLVTSWRTIPDELRSV
jgi:hypothetical protein